MLELQNVGLTYFSQQGEIEAVKDINIKVPDGEFVAILGPSGCGKTTILSLISGLLTPTKGKILLNGSPISKHDNKTGYMFQKDHLFEWRKVLKNIQLGLEIRKKYLINKFKNEWLENNKFEVPKNFFNKIKFKIWQYNQIKKYVKSKLKEEYEYANNLLKKYGLWEFRNHYPNQLSGGMRQRVALIRTLALKPDILLLDEPFSALDYQTRLNLCDDVSKIIKNENKTAILVTHDITEALSMANIIIVLSKRPGTIKSVHVLNIDSNLTPLQRRESGSFLGYFDKIWRELQDDQEK